MEKLTDTLHLIAFIAFMALSIVLILTHVGILTMSAGVISVYKANCIITGLLTIMMLM